MGAGRGPRVGGNLTQGVRACLPIGYGTFFYSVFLVPGTGSGTTGKQVPVPVPFPDAPPSPLRPFPVSVPVPVLFP